MVLEKHRLAVIGDLLKILKDILESYSKTDQFFEGHFSL